MSTIHLNYFSWKFNRIKRSLWCIFTSKGQVFKISNSIAANKSGLIHIPIFPSVLCAVFNWISMCLYRVKWEKVTVFWKSTKKWAQLKAKFSDTHIDRVAVFFHNFRISEDRKFILLFDFPFILQICQRVNIKSLSSTNNSPDNQTFRMKTSRRFTKSNLINSRNFIWIWKWNLHFGFAYNSKNLIRSALDIARKWKWESVFAFVADWIKI